MLFSSVPILLYENIFACVNKLAEMIRTALINKLPHYLPERKAIAASLQLHEANDSFGKGFHALKDHVLNRLMTGRRPRKSLQLRPKFHSLFLKNSFDFRKSATE